MNEVNLLFTDEPKLALNDILSNYKARTSPGQKGDVMLLSFEDFNSDSAKFPPATISNHF